MMATLMDYRPDYHPNTDIESPKKTSTILVIIANLVPLLGVLFFNWDLANVVILYWIENLIIGAWNIPRILMAGNNKANSPKLFLAGFFTVHYGIFCLVHGTFILVMLGFKDGAMSPFSAIANGDLLTKGVLIGTATMFITTGWNFYDTYIANSAYKEQDVTKAMFSPYGHIVVIHIAIIATAFISMSTGSPLWLLILLVVGKTLLELKSGKIFKSFKTKKNA